MAAPPARPDDSSLRRFLRLTGSLKSAVCLLFFFALASLIGMYVESRTDATFAREHVYNAWWFNLAFGFLWLNIFSATMVRYPWPKRLTGFVITHLGLLLIIVGALVTRIFGVEGQMMLQEGEISSVLLQSEREALHVKLPNGRKYQVPGHRLKRLSTDQPLRVGDSAWGVEVTEYFMRSRVERGYVRAPDGPPAVELVMSGGMFGDRASWCLPANPDARARRAGSRMLLMDTQWLSGPEAVAKFEMPPSAEEDAGKLRLRLPDGSERMIDVGALQKGPVELSKDVQVVQRKLLRNAIVEAGPDGGSMLVDSPDPRRGAGPAIEFGIEWAGGVEEHAAFARIPDFHSKKGGHAEGASPEKGYRGWYEVQEQVFSGRGVSFGVTPEGEILARIYDEQGRPGATVHRLAVGQPLETPWNGISVTVRQFLESARRHVELVDASGDPAGSGEAPIPGMRFNLYGPSGMEPVWMQFHTRKPTHHPDGHVDLHWSWGEYPLDFQVRLLDFRKVDYPGTTRAASFESDVRVQDPLRKRDEQVTISMNYPMEHGGVVWWPGSDWSFFQSSYQQPEGGPEISIFSVAYDPGYAINMLGSGLVVFGIFTMFYLVPYFRPKRKRKTAASAAAA